MISESFLLWLLGLSLAPIVFSYSVYPLCIGVLAQAVGDKQSPALTGEHSTPTVTILIAAHNEESVIHNRIENALASDYAHSLFEVLVVSDGSTDTTESIVESFDDTRVRLIAQTPNQGKSSALNRALPEAMGEIIVMTDANTHFTSSAVSNLVARLSAPDKPIAVCGKLVIVDPESGNNVDSLYWRYESWQKRCEGILGATLGANGGIYAFRAQDYVAIPNNTILDDMTIPLLMKLIRGGKVVFAPEAVATEEAAQNITEEFARRVRIGTGAYQSIRLLWPLLRPKNGFTSIAFFSHKLLRWFTPHLLIASVVVTIVGLQYTSLRLAGVIWLFVGAAAWAGSKTTGSAAPLRLVRLLSMFASMNIALLLGFSRWLRENQTGTWKRTTRDN